MKKRALLSVSDKTGLVPLAKALIEKGYELVSSGGTFKTLQQAGLDVIAVADVTKMPEMLGGRVKTLHPSIHGGLLADLDLKEHQQTLEEHEIAAIAVLVVNLYPFKQTVAAQKPFADCIENIDIGGPAMIRAAAKNHKHVIVVTDPADYNHLIETIDNVSPDQLKNFAAKAFRHTADYDAAIAQYFSQQLQQPLANTFLLSGNKISDLRYGENPHQAAAVYRYNQTVSPLNAKQLQGKPLSYNNLNDADAAFSLMLDLHQTSNKAVVTIIKHATPCGVAIADTALNAWEKSLAADPVSAFGGVVAFNQPVDKLTAEALKKLFLEIVIAPEFSDEAQTILAKKKNLRLLSLGELPKEPQDNYRVKSLTGGFLVQHQDNLLIKAEDWECVTNQQPDSQQLIDMHMAFVIAKHVKSNAIVLVKDGATIGIGGGQTSRVLAAEIAIQQAKTNTTGAVAASDAFFPFADGAEVCLNAGITALVQPGGSKRDDEVIAAVNQANACMMFTGTRHFLH